jgi:hypothetical protein
VAAEHAIYPVLDRLETYRITEKVQPNHDLAPMSWLPSPEMVDLETAPIGPAESNERARCIVDRYALKEPIDV